jgi:hypothetical protein
VSRRYTVITISAVLMLAFAGVLLAQQQQEGRGQWSAMREKYKYTLQLTQMVRHIQEIDKDKKYTLKPSQAKQVLAVLKPLRSKPKMTQDQARQALKDLKKVFTADQLNAIARIKPRFGAGQGTSRRPGQTPGQGPGMGQREPGTSGGPGGQSGRRFDPNAMKDFNPFYAKAPKGDERAARRAARWNEFFAGLEQKAKVKSK